LEPIFNNIYFVNGNTVLHYVTNGFAIFSQQFLSLIFGNKQAKTLTHRSGNISMEISDHYAHVLNGGNLPRQYSRVLPKAGLCKACLLSDKVML